MLNAPQFRLSGPGNYRPRENEGPSLCMVDRNYCFNSNTDQREHALSNQSNVYEDGAEGKSSIAEGQDICASTETSTHKSSNRDKMEAMVDKLYRNRIPRASFIHLGFSLTL